MKHYIIMIKSYNIDEAGDDILEDAAVSAVKHTHEEAMAGVKHIADEYAEDGYVVQEDDVHETDGVLIAPNVDMPSYYINVYVQEIN